MATISIFNTLTSSLEPLIPRSGRRIRWYTCGPTVYDAAHLGHARNYVAQDIIRRILEDYFGYDVDLTMNVTDIDDKIIARSQELQISMTDLTKRYEQEFFRDMDQLNIKRPSMLTRVSEFIPNIIVYIQKIVDNGFAYPANGSVYFDLTAYTQKFKYGRLHPFDGSELTDESMSGRLKDKNPDKRSQLDFALWKATKDGEPFWNSPWGPGRMGWHVECSVMATAILGPSFDLHSGGEDLKFPHHENELAQATAHEQNNNWVNYFIHTGHLHIDGCKMAKSLKNFITIENALQRYTSRQLRILFLLHHYRSVLNYTPNVMKTALDTDQTIHEFLNQMRGLIDASEVAVWTPKEEFLKTKFAEIKDAVTLALQNDFDTPKVFESISQLIKHAYSYVNLYDPNVYLIRSIRDYIIHILNIFGLDYNLSVQSDSLLPGVLDSITQFRDELRKIIKNPEFTDVKSLRKELFKLSDTYRDDVLPSVGINLDDAPNGKGIWKIK